MTEVKRSVEKRWNGSKRMCRAGLRGSRRKVLTKLERCDKINKLSPREGDRMYLEN